MRHELKCWPPYFERLLDGSKTFEVRKDDRGYQTGDWLVLREWDPAKCRIDSACNGRYDGYNPCPAYTRRVLEFKVGFIFKSGFGVDLGQHVVMSLIEVTS
jgi:hypothetical protein